MPGAATTTFSAEHCGPCPTQTARSQYWPADRVWPSAVGVLLGAPAAGRAGGRARGRRRGEHLGHVGVDFPLTGRGGYRYPVVAVVDEMQPAQAVDLDRRERLAAPLGQREPLPAGSHPAGGRPEAAVEVAARTGGAGDRVEPDRLQPQLPLSAPAERAGDLIERRKAASAGGPAAQAAR